MATDVLMPQMGESVAEGTIVRWIKQVGESVGKDEPLFEISTDKVDAEIPSPEAGILSEIRVQEGETVAVHTVVAVITGAAASTGTTAAASRPAAAPERVSVAAAGESRPAARAAEVPPRRAASPARTPAPVRTSDPASRLRTLSSPVVRNIAREHGIDITEVPGTGISGRVTRRDIEAFIAAGGAAREARRDRPAPYQPGDDVRIEKLSIMRRKIAEHMVESVRTSAHIYSAYEADFSRIDELRRAHRERYEQAGTRLTFTAFIARAVAETIRQFPIVNASLDGDDVVYKNEINLGIAVALEQGLIVPVVRGADRLSLMDLCKAIQDLSTRARTKQLRVEDVEGGTFTLTNPGIFGGLWGLPIINQPQVAILAVGSVDKRVVVVDDRMVIRPMCYLTMGYDHRLIDGADGGRFLQALKERLERFDESCI